jgi:hypothetical protein
MAASNGQADCLEVILTLPFVNRGFVSEYAAGVGHLACMRVAHQAGDKMFPGGWVAARQGTCQLTF